MFLSSFIKKRTHRLKENQHTTRQDLWNQDKKDQQKNVRENGVRIERKSSKKLKMITCFLD